MSAAEESGEYIPSLVKRGDSSVGRGIGYAAEKANSHP